MMRADTINPKSLRAGLSVLEPLLRGDIITLRCDNQGWLFELTANLLVRNHSRKTLYMHWVDYHKRFWTLDYDYIARLAKREGKDISGIYFQRAFSRDNNEVEENWRRVSEFAKFDLLILDSVSELYEERKPDSLPMTYSIGKFAQLCIRNDCCGLILDRSARPIHPYLGHVSSIIIQFIVDREEIAVELVKHPSMPDLRMSIPRNNQYKLSRWL